MAAIICGLAYVAFWLAEGGEHYSPSGPRQREVSVHVATTARALDVKAIDAISECRDLLSVLEHLRVYVVGGSLGLRPACLNSPSLYMRMEEPLDVGHQCILLPKVDKTTWAWSSLL